MSAATKPPTSATKPTFPIDLLPGDLSSLFAQLQPILLLTSFYFRFPSLVADPTSTLLQDLLPLATLQVAYAVVCLPAVGSNGKVVKKVKIGAQKAKGEVPTAKAFTLLLSLLLTTLSIPVLTAIQILFGAPLTTHLPQTILTSSHLALLAIFPLIYVHGAEAKKWREIISVYSPLDEVFGATLGAFVGGWVGAVPIPLDWDREWQKWPVTIVTGVVGGYVVGGVLGGRVWRGKRVELD